MLDSTTLGLCQLPLEVLHRIVYYLDILDILRIRRVSRYLTEVSRCRNVWSDAYCTAEFVHPPGPFPSQSAHDLEKVLLSSFHVERSLCHRHNTAHWERPVLRPRRIWYTGMALLASLVFRRFLLVAFSDQIRYYDLNLRKLRARIIYRSKGSVLKELDCISTIDGEGRRFACIVLNEQMQTTRRISIYSLNVGEKFKLTLDLFHQFERTRFDIDGVDLGPRVIIVQGQVGREFEADSHLVALDVHTRTQFLLPSVTHMMSEAAEMSELECTILPVSISTSTHLLLAWPFYTMATGWRTYFKAFALPHPTTHHQFTSTSIPLSPSHSGIISDIHVNSMALLHDSVIDPTTRDVLISIRVHADSSHLKHGILRLSGASTSHDHEVGTVTLQLLGSLGQHSHTPYIHPSLNGTGRVFYMLNTGLNWTVSAFDYILRPRSDDGEQEAKVVEYSSLLRYPTPRMLLDYDPYSGRICLQSDVANYSVIEIIDFA